MALLWCDGCDSYASAAELTDKWSTVANTVGTAFGPTAGRFGGGALGTGSSSSNPFRKTLPTFGGSGVALNMGLWLKTAGANGAVGPVSIFAVGTQPLLTSTVSGGTTLQLTSAANVVIATVTAVFGDGNWHWLEMQIVLSTTTTGSMTLYMDGIQLAHVTGVVTASSGTLTQNIFAACGMSATANGYIDDVLFWDSTGSAFNTFPLGPRRISTLIPSGAGSSTQFTPSTGTNWSCVAGAYSGTAFVSDTGTGNTDLYTYPNIPINPASINAVVGNYFGQNPGVGTANLIPKMETSGTVVSGSTIPLANGANSLNQYAWYTDAGGSAWVFASVNAMQVGMED